MNSGSGLSINSWWGGSAALSLFCFVVAVLSGSSGVVSELSSRTNDSFFRIRDRFDQTTSVVVVYIDDASLSEQGRWPWRRSQLAELIDYVAVSKPRSIGLDILLSEASDEAEDRALAAALGRAGNVVLPAKITTSAAGPLWIEPLPQFSSAAMAVGHVQAVLDADGVCRRLPAAEMTLHGPLLMMSKMLADIPGKSQTTATQTSTGEVLQAQLVTIDYRGLANGSPPSRRSFPTISAASLFHGDVYDFRGKTVLIGFAGTGLEDELLTPLSYSTPAPGVLIQANMVDTLTRSRELTTVHPLIQLAMLLGLCFAGGRLMQQQNTLRIAMWLSLSLIGTFGAAYICFLLWGLQFDLGPALVAEVLLVLAGQLQHIVLIQSMIGQSLGNLQRQAEGLPLYLAGALVPQLMATFPTQTLASSEAKIALIARTDRQLAIVSGFQQSLLDGMRDGIAVFDEFGTSMFANQAWRGFLDHSGWVDTMVWPEVSRLLYPAGVGSSSHGLNPAVMQRRTLQKTDKEVLISGQLWRLSMVRLPAVTSVRKRLYMVISADLTPQLERDQARQQALQFITHELRTPLVSLLGFAELLQHFPEQAREAGAADVIQTESERLIALTTMFLECLKLETALPVVSLEATNIEVVLQKTSSLAKSLCRASNKKLVVLRPAGGVVANLDCAMMTGALLNLVANAVKYGSDKSDVVIRVTTDSDNVTFAVHNRGPRIPDDEIPRLFAPQYRLVDNTAGRMGWGIGLAFVKRVLDAHGGEVRVMSDEIETSFQLVLPLTPFVHEADDE